MPRAYRYAFDESVPLEEVEASLLLAVFAAESLHGEAAVRLEAGRSLDRPGRSCEIDAGSEAGADLNRIFLGLLQREFDPADIAVTRLESHDERAACA